MSVLNLFGGNEAEVWIGTISRLVGILIFSLANPPCFPPATSHALALLLQREFSYTYDVQIDSGVWWCRMASLKIEGDGVEDGDENENENETQKDKNEGS